MNNEMMYKMFLNTISKMNDVELEKALTKAHEVLSDNDYNSLLALIEKEKNNMK